MDIFLQKIPLKDVLWNLKMGSGGPDTSHSPSSPPLSKSESTSAAQSTRQFSAFVRYLSHCFPHFSVLSAYLHLEVTANYEKLVPEDMMMACIASLKWYDKLV
jgi:hypothetical protein